MKLELGICNRETQHDWCGPRLEIAKEERALTYGVRTQKGIPGLVRVQWMLVLAGWKRNYLVLVCIYFLVSGLSLSWSLHFDLFIYCGSKLFLVKILFSFVLNSL